VFLVLAQMIDVSKDKLFL